MTTVAVVQARMGSTRLPGKVLMELGGRPMLALMLERLGPLVGRGLDQVVVATSTLNTDDPIADVAAGLGTPVVRGSEADVLSRFLSALDQHPADTVVRLTADCPLIDPALVADALDLHAASGATYTSNTLVRTFPDGLDVEVVSGSALRQAGHEAVDPAEREHVTPFVYRRPARFELRALRIADHLGDERWTIDTADDLADLRAVVDDLASPVEASWRQILAVAGRRRGPSATQLWVRPFEPTDEDALDQAGRRPPADLAARADDPAQRSWTAEMGGDPVGWLTVAVDDGVGRLRSSLPPGLGPEARRLLDRQLAADRQVVSLFEDA